ncbi:MAG: 4-(cytidine 5'-diphospho)-2-C-methyl-D-erythritol kinase [Sphingomonas sp.]|nr:4-(cytidine 5'-diphospho)-2-C-methyl-D-erythritol kinase [Sphingomonas sp.]
MIVELAPAKINLALHVRHRRADGYHELETLFAFLRDGDVIRIEPSAEAVFTLSGPFGAALSAEGDNLVTRAADRFAEVFGTSRAVRIDLEKHLPIASGIGGGSADAAAALRALARLNDIAVDDLRLFNIAEALGADVPACLLGKSALGEGKGERLRPVEGVTDVPVLLVNPGVAVSTASVFRGWDQIDRGPIPTGSLIASAVAGRNDLEPTARLIAPVIGDVVNILAAAPDVLLARMSGSGATCFALYASEQARKDAANAIRAAHADWWCLESTLG